jgi:histidinol-phosphate aminotransferase
VYWPPPTVKDCTAKLKVWGGWAKVEPLSLTTIRYWRDWLAEKLAALGLQVMPSVGNFLLVRFAQDKARDANAADAYLARRGIIPRKVAGYGLPDCLRITVGTEAETRAVAQALGDFLAGKPA